MLREKRTNLGQGRAIMYTPCSAPWAMRGLAMYPRSISRLQQARGFLQLLGQQLYCLMLRLIRRADHHLPGDGAIQIHGKVLFKTVEGFGTAFATVAHVLISRDAPVRCDVLLDTSPARSTPGLARCPA